MDTEADTASLRPSGDNPVIPDTGLVRNKKEIESTLPMVLGGDAVLRLLDYHVVLASKAQEMLSRTQRLALLHVRIESSALSKLVFFSPAMIGGRRHGAGNGCATREQGEECNNNRRCRACLHGNSVEVRRHVLNSRDQATVALLTIPILITPPPTIGYLSHDSLWPRCCPGSGFRDRLLRSAERSVKQHGCKSLVGRQWKVISEAGCRSASPAPTPRRTPSRRLPRCPDPLRNGWRRGRCAAMAHRPRSA